MYWAVNEALNVCRGAVAPDTPHSEVFLEQVWETAKKAHRVLKEEAASIGTQAHRSLEAIFRGQLHQRDTEPEQEAGGGEVEVCGLQSDPRVGNCVQAAKAWLSDHSVSPLEVERRIYSRRYRYSGTLDKLAIVDGQLSLIDWKTGGLYPSHRYQTAAYVAAYEEETGEKISARWLVRLGKEDGAFEAHRFNRTDYVNDFRGFKGALILYNNLRAMKN